MLVDAWKRNFGRNYDIKIRALFLHPLQTRQEDTTLYTGLDGSHLSAHISNDGVVF
jgi:hypothetical protein